MYQNRFVLCSAAALLALAVACSKSSPSPASPTSTQEASGDAAADGSTLKVPAPSPVSPKDGAQPDTLVLTANKVTGKFNSSLNPSYEFRIKTSGGSVVSACTQVVGPGSGNTVSYTPTCTLDLDTLHTWSIRGTLNGANGPWSTDASFKSPLGGYIRGNELFDPLVGGRTVGSLGGAAQLTPDGVSLPDHFSWVKYELPQTLIQGEFSMMIKGLVVESPGTQGAKSKVFSMQEGGGSITTDDYRATIEFRGKQYPTPGAVTFRIITGDAIHRVFDGPRIVVGGWDRNKWYFWRFSWVTGRATLEVREGSETGPVKYLGSTGTGSHEYRPTPHVLYLGAPDARGGADDMTACPITIKSVWASSNPRPLFPQ